MAGCEDGAGRVAGLEGVVVVEGNEEGCLRWWIVGIGEGRRGGWDEFRIGRLPADVLMRC